MSTVLSFFCFPLLPILIKLTHLVGTITGEVMVWELGMHEKLAQRNFKVWELKSRSMPLQVGLEFIFI